jgi:Rieske Fe-S protein
MMDRKEFLKTCGIACLSGSVITTLFQSCSSSHYYADSDLIENSLRVSQTAFTQDKKGQAIDRKYVLVKSDKLNFPIYLYKRNDTEYSALWMECTHQGAELSAHGEYLTCPSHGAEFDKEGNVTQGPAQKNLRKFKTTLQDQFIYIQLS